jgi:hypothetical protein
MFIITGTNNRHDDSYKKTNKNTNRHVNAEARKLISDATIASTMEDLFVLKEQFFLRVCTK